MGIVTMLKAEEQYEAGYISGYTTSIQSLVQVVHSTSGVFGDTSRFSWRLYDGSTSRNCRGHFR